MIVTERRLAEGEKLPRGYGVAWASPYSFTYVCLPIPLNRIVGAFRAWYLAWRRPIEDDPIVAAYRYGEAIGFQRGRDSGAEATHRIYRGMLADVLADVTALRKELGY